MDENTKARLDSENLSPEKQNCLLSQAVYAVVFSGKTNSEVPEF